MPKGSYRLSGVVFCRGLSATERSAERKHYYGIVIRTSAFYIAFNPRRIVSCLVIRVNTLTFFLQDIIRLYFCWSRQQRPTVAITDEKSIPTARPTIRPTIESILVPSPEPSIATTPISPHSHIALSHSNELRRVTGDYMV